MKPFIPRWLDELELRAAPFRVLCHLWRRRGTNGACYPSAEQIAKVCRLNVDTVWSAILELEARGVLHRRKAFRNSNQYDLIVPKPITGKEGVTRAPESPEKEGQQSPETEGRHPAEKRGRQSPEKRGRKGIPSKVPHLSVPSEGGNSLPPFEALTLSEEQKRLVRAMRIEKPTRKGASYADRYFAISDGCIEALLRYYNTKRQAYWSRDRVCDYGHFYLWLNEDKHVPRLVAEHIDQEKSKAINRRITMQLEGREPEPENHGPLNGHAPRRVIKTTTAHPDDPPF